MIRAVKNNDKLIISLMLVLISLVLTATIFRSAFLSFADGVIQLGRSLFVYGQFLFLQHLPQERPIMPPSGEIGLPSTSGDIWQSIGQYFRILFSGENFVNYFRGFEAFLLGFVSILPFLIIIFYVLRKYIRHSFVRHNNNYNKDTKTLKTFKSTSAHVYSPVKQYLLSLLIYIKNSRIRRALLLIWLFNFNVFAMFLHVIAILLYFFISFDIVALYYFVRNILVLLLPALMYLSWWIGVPVGIYLIDRFRKRVALSRLRHMENKNKGFILERSICTMLVGTMGKGKTTLMTDIALSTEAIFRYKAYEMMLEIDLKFPHFPYIVLENQLKEAMDKGIVFNLASCSEWIDEKENAFCTALKFRPRNINFARSARGKLPFTSCDRLVKCPDLSYIMCEYDFQRYGLVYDDKKTITTLFEALKDYAKLYLIYITSSSLIMSNYSIRTDFEKIDGGNMPYWNLDFFERDSKKMRKRSRMSHILDFDMLRLGKKLIENNAQSNCFEFGVVVITEIGKERGNQFKDKEIQAVTKNLKETIKELEKVKADCSDQKAELIRLTNKATQLTDKFNDSLKLIRHKSTVNNFPFARVLMDEQRPESLGADARDLCEIVHIMDKSEIFLAMPFFFIGELFHSLIFPRFKGTYQDYRINRGDNTFLMFVLKKLGAGIHRYYMRIYNRFSYHIRYLAVEDAATGKVLKESRYYLSTKKIYSNRFATDAYNDIFAKGLKQCKVGLDDIEEYEGFKATEHELKQQHSYFINEIVKYGSAEEKENDS